MNKIKGYASKVHRWFNGCVLGKSLQMIKMYGEDRASSQTSKYYSIFIFILCVVPCIIYVYAFPAAPPTLEEFVLPSFKPFPISSRIGILL